MLKKLARNKRAGLIGGWISAFAVLLAFSIYVGIICSRDLSLVLFVNGEQVCKVEDRATVDRALILLEEKLTENQIVSPEELNVSFKYVHSPDPAVSSAKECMELLYSLSSDDYSRAYMISVGGIAIAACPTYSEAQKVVTDFSDFITDKVLKDEDKCDQVQLTTEFKIESVFCMSDYISSASDIYRALVNEGVIFEESSDSITGTRVNAAGSQSYLSANKSLLFGLNKNEKLEIFVNDDFSISIGGLDSAIEYKTIVIEKYSEIVSFKTEYIETDELFIGQSQVVSEGENGLAENEYEVAYADGVEISRTLISSKTISEAKNRVELVGTKEYPSTKPTGSFMWPLKGRFYITSNYGENRGALDAVSGYHLGIDLAYNLGTPIYAADGGKVIFAGSSGSYGLLVKIEHEEGVVTYYAHCRKLYVKEGDLVYKGQQIAEIGMTGNVSGPHVHFEVRIDGATVNPKNYLPK